MIIKSLSRKAPSFGQLAAYVLAAKGARIDLRHNLPVTAETPEAIVRAFEENHALLSRRANGNALYHEIIALPPTTALPVTDLSAALVALAERYLDQRAPRQMAVGVVHGDTAHVHIHLMISSNPVLSRQRVRLSKRDFATIQREMEDARLRLYPALGPARPYTAPRAGMKRSTREQEAIRRRGAPNRKDDLAAALGSVMNEATGREALDRALADMGIALYRRGRSVGVVTKGGRRYRLDTLGLLEPYTEALTRFDLVESRLASLRRGRSKPDRERER